MKSYRIICFMWFSTVRFMVEAVYSPALVVADMNDAADFTLAPLKGSGRDALFWTLPSVYLNLACPPSDDYEKEVNDQSRTKRALIVKKRQKKEISLYEIKFFCKFPVRAAIRYDDFYDRHRLKIRQEEIEERNVYSIGFEFYKMPRYDGDSNAKPNLKVENDFSFLDVIEVTLDKKTEETVSITYVVLLKDEEILPLKSTQKIDQTINYDKTPDVIHFDLEKRYEDFRQKLPDLEEKSLNAIAHDRGIKKMPLVPEDDFYLNTWKAVTYFDLLTAPVWQVLTCTWRRAEIFVRKLMIVARKLRIFVGASGTSSISYNSEPARETMLHVPLYTWKIVQMPEVGEEHVLMLIVMHNDPFHEKQKRICQPSVCTTNGWAIDNDDYKTGLMYCCQFTQEVAEELGIFHVYYKMRMGIDEGKPFVMFNLNENYEGYPENLLEKMTKINNVALVPELLDPLSEVSEEQGGGCIIM